MAKVSGGMRNYSKNYNTKQIWTKRNAAFAVGEA